MPAGVVAELRQPAVQWPVVAVLHALEILPHLFRLPTWIVSEFGDVFPVRTIRTNQNHGIVSRATAQRAGSRIIDPVYRLALELRKVVRIKLLLSYVAIVTDKEVPFHGLI